MTLHVEEHVPLAFSSGIIVGSEGYLAHKKQPPPPKDYHMTRARVQDGGGRGAQGVGQVARP